MLSVEAAKTRERRIEPLLAPQVLRMLFGAAGPGQLQSGKTVLDSSSAKADTADAMIGGGPPDLAVD